MKKITLLFAFLIASIGFSQTELLTNGDFSNGADSWGGSAFTVVSGEAYFSSTNAGGDPWSTQLTQGGLVFVNSQEYTLTFYARAAANRQISVAIQNVGAWTDQFRQENINLTTSMTEYTYTFNATSDNSNVQVGFLMAGFGSTDAIYYDDISLTTDGTVPETCNDGILNNGETEIDCGGPNCAPCAVPPATAAPTPPNRAAADVKSIFSDAYSDISVDTFDTTWCPGTTSDVEIDGNPTKKVVGLGCEGVEFLTGRFDATEFTHFHMDFYTSTPTLDQSFNLKFSNWNGGGGEANAIEFSTTNASDPALPNPNPGTWISLDIPLTSWTAGSRNDLVQFIITSTLGTVYYDNLYLHKNTTLGLDDLNAASFNVYPNPTENVWNVKTNNTTINSVQVFDVLGKEVISLNPNSEEVKIDASTLTTGLYFARIESLNGIKTIKLIRK